MVLNCACTRLPAALEWFGDARGHFAEGKERLATLLRLSGTVGPAVRARALAAAKHARRLGEYDTAQGYLDE